MSQNSFVYIQFKGLKYGNLTLIILFKIIHLLAHS